MTIPKEVTDDVLLRRAAKGDEEAFTLVYRRHQAAIYRFALRMTGSPWAAEEIVQDVFMTLVRDPKKYDVLLGTAARGSCHNRSKQRRSGERKAKGEGKERGGEEESRGRRQRRRERNKK